MIKNLIVQVQDMSASHGTALAQSRHRAVQSVEVRGVLSSHTCFKVEHEPEDLSEGVSAASKLQARKQMIIIKRRQRQTLIITRYAKHDVNGA